MHAAALRHIWGWSFAGTGEQNTSADPPPLAPGPAPATAVAPSASVTHNTTVLQTPLQQLPVLFNASNSAESPSITDSAMHKAQTGH